MHLVYSKIFVLYAVLAYQKGFKSSETFMILRMHLITCITFDFITSFIQTHELKQDLIWIQSNMIRMSLYKNMSFKAAYREIYVKTYIYRRDPLLQCKYLNEWNIQIMSLHFELTDITRLTQILDIWNDFYCCSSAINFMV